MRMLRMLSGTSARNRERIQRGRMVHRGRIKFKADEIEATVKKSVNGKSPRLLSI
jgi:hypothetical protein